MRRRIIIEVPNRKLGTMSVDPGRRKTAAPAKYSIADLEQMQKLVKKVRHAMEVRLSELGAADDVRDAGCIIRELTRVLEEDVVLKLNVGPVLYLALCLLSQQLDTTLRYYAKMPRGVRLKNKSDVAH